MLNLPKERVATQPSTCSGGCGETTALSIDTAADVEPQEPNPSSVGRNCPRSGSITPGSSHARTAARARNKPSRATNRSWSTRSNAGSNNADHHLELLHAADAACSCRGVEDLAENARIAAPQWHAQAPGWSLDQLFAPTFLPPAGLCTLPPRANAAQTGRRHLKGGRCDRWRGLKRWASAMRRSSAARGRIWAR